MREDQIDRAEKLRVTLQDADVRRQQQGSTFHQHAQSMADETNRGRFVATGAPTVIASKPAIAAAYPACSPALAVQLPDEPPLGFDNPELEPSMAIPCSSSIEATGGPADAPSSDDGGPAIPPGGSMSERAGSSLSQADQDADQ